MKTIHFIFSGLFLLNVLLAQDIIFTNIGKVYEGKIIEIGNNYIKYKRKELPDGPVYTIDKNIVIKIKYSNNKEEVFNNNYNEPKNNESENTETGQEGIRFDSLILKKKNIAGYDVSQFVFVSIGISYERFFGKNSRFSIRIPLSLGFKYIGNENNLIVTDNSGVSSNNYYYVSEKNNNYYMYQNGKLAGGSVEFNYYPAKSKRFSYFIGPYIEYGVFAYKIAKLIEYTSYDYYGNPFPQVKTEYSPLRYDGQHIAGGINNGFLYHFNQVFTLTGTFGLGLKKDETPVPNDRVLTQVRFNLIFGARF